MKAEKKRYTKPTFKKHKAAALVSGSNCSTVSSRVRKGGLYYF